MGPFHACCIFLAVLGKRFGSAGLREIIVEAGLTGPGSVEAILRGKHYNRGLRVMKTVYEALLRLKLEAFENWMHHVGKFDVIADFLESRELMQLVETRTQKNMQNVINCSTVFQECFQQFEDDIQNNKYGPMARFWQSFLDMVQILLDYIKSTRNGDWDLHLSSMERMLPWFHAYDRVNYARHFTYCWATLKNLPESKPDMYYEFQRGNFSVKRSDGKFNMLPPDQVIEQTINRDQKGPGSIIGITTSVGTVQRWVFSSHVVAEINADFKGSIHIDQTSSVTKDLGKKRKVLDENRVKHCYEVFTNWNNPFLLSEELVSINSGVAATEEIARDIERAEDVGQSCLNDFIENRIKSNEENFNDPIKKNKLLTFENTQKKITSKSKGLTMALRSDRETFGRLLLIQKERDISMKETLTFELTPLPLSLANADGTLSKTVKSKLFAELAGFVPQVYVCPENTPSIFDGMVLLQKVPPTLCTFGDIADYLLNKILNNSCRIAFFVTDFYLPCSIKSLERRQRSAIGTLRMKISYRNQQKPKSWSKYLQHPDNKVELVKFLINDWWQNESNVEVLSNRELYITCEDKAYCISSNGIHLQKVDVIDLQSSQEEADTKMFLCAQFAATLGFESVKIVTVDTDVAVLAMYYTSRIDCRIYLEIGTAAKTMVYDVSSHNLEQSICDALPGLHALSGCDTTSCFNGIGKVKCLKVLQTKESFIDGMRLLGSNVVLNDSVQEVLEEYTCRLYGVKVTENVNDARYRLFTGKKKFPDPHKLPPSSNALHFHFKRANYQTFEWKQALHQDHQYIDPEGHGWTRSNTGDLEVQWTSQPSAPETLLDFFSCECKKTKCSNNLCYCKKANRSCSDMCNCQQCENSQNEKENETHFEESDDSSDEETYESDNDSSRT